MTDVFGVTKSVERLPDNLLIEIFKYLPLKDLCATRRVCKRWHRVASDNALWRRVDLRHYKLNLKEMWKLIRCHFSDVLISLHLRGYMDQSVINWKKHSLSYALLKEIQHRSPNIKELELIQMNMTDICALQLPHQLEVLKMTNSHLPQGWFQDLKHNPCKSTLRHLDLSDSRMISLVDMEHLSCLTQLDCLKVNGCYRINEKAIRVITESFPHLRILEVSSTKCTDLALHYISRNLAEIVRLNLSHCYLITNAGLADVCVYLKHLQWLDLESCSGITDEGAKNLHHLERLKECNIKSTKITEEAINKLRCLNNCQLICK